ncbi:DNA polymerase delta subunit 3, partial [Lecanoromycetidae sp. Uapishka_2]
MAPDPRTFLAAEILNDGKNVSKTSNRMLYEFHQTQISKKPGSIHATYLLDGLLMTANGTHTNGHGQDGEDVHMQSSPYMSSSMPQGEPEEGEAPQRSIILAREADLTAAKERFERIHSIHVYSLGPSSVQRRTGKRPLVAVPAALVAKPTAKLSGKVQAMSQQDPPSSSPFNRPSSSGKAAKSMPQVESISEPKTARANEPDKKAMAKPAKLKREQSDLFKSFSKPSVKLKREDTGSSAEDSPAAVESMKDASGDEQEDDFIQTNTTSSKAAKSQRAEREEKLRKMMEDEDEAMEDSAEEPPEISQDSEPIDVPTSQKESSPEPPVAVSGGRRRGRRKVMRKKTMKDDEGYLVTKEEPTWESFSEEEPPPQKERTPASTASSSAKSKKSGGQGNIMSFFGKR